MSRLMVECIAAWLIASVAWRSGWIASAMAIERRFVEAGYRWADLVDGPAETREP